MKRLIACVALLAASMALVVAREQMTRAGDDSIKFKEGSFHRGPAEFSGWRGEPLRQVLLKNLAKKIDSMTDEEKQKALESTFAEIRILEAAEHLDQTAVALKAIVKNYEGTRSAETAKRMLELHDEPGSWLPISGPVPTSTPDSPERPALPVPHFTVPFTR